MTYVLRAAAYELKHGHENNCDKQIAVRKYELLIPLSGERRLAEPSESTIKPFDNREIHTENALMRTRARRDRRNFVMRMCEFDKI